MWHGIVIDVSFKNKNFLKCLKILGKRKSDKWLLLKIEVLDKDVEKFAKDIQKNLKDGFYSHLYSEDGNLIVIFQKKIFRIKSDKSTWNSAINYGKSVGIPENELDFYPCRFEDETY